MYIYIYLYLNIYMYTYRHINIYGSTTHLPSEMPLSRVSETSDVQHQLRPSRRASHSASLFRNTARANSL